MRGAPARAIQELAGHQGSRDDATVHALESGRAGYGHSFVGRRRGKPWRNREGGENKLRGAVENRAPAAASERRREVGEADRERAARMGKWRGPIRAK